MIALSCYFQHFSNIEGFKKPAQIMIPQCKFFSTKHAAKNIFPELYFAVHQLMILSNTHMLYQIFGHTKTNRSFLRFDSLIDE